MQPAPDRPLKTQVGQERHRAGWIVALIVVATLIIVCGCFNVAVYLSHNICFAKIPSLGQPTIQTAGGVMILSHTPTSIAWRIRDGSVVWQEPTNVEDNALTEAGPNLYYGSTTDSPSYSSAINARNLETGDIVWQATLPNYSPVLALVTTPTSIIGLLQSDSNNLMAWRLTDGRPLWQTTVIPNAPDWNYSNLTILGSTVIYSDQSGVHAFDAATGKPLWQFADAAYAYNILHVALNATAIIIVTRDPPSFTQNRLIALQPTTGKILWQTTVTAPQPLPFASVLADDLSYTIEGTTLVARQARDGTVRWQRAITQVPDLTGVTDLGDVVTVAGPVATADGAASATFSLLILDRATGQVRANATMSHILESERGYAVNAGKVWFTQDDNSTVAYDAHTAQRLFSRAAPHGLSIQSTIPIVTATTAFVVYSTLTSTCPRRHIEGVQALNVGNGQVAWTHSLTLPY